MNLYAGVRAPAPRAHRRAAPLTRRSPVGHRRDPSAQREGVCRPAHGREHGGDPLRPQRGQAPAHGELDEADDRPPDDGEHEERRCRAGRRARALGRRVHDRPAGRRAPQGRRPSLGGAHPERQRCCVRARDRHRRHREGVRPDDERARHRSSVSSTRTTSFPTGSTLPATTRPRGIPTRSRDRT